MVKLDKYVLTEIESEIIIKGLWGKAFANSNGDEANAKSIYMKYRVQSIKDIFIARKISYNELTKQKLFQYIQDKIIPKPNDSTDLSNNKLKTKKYKVSESVTSGYNKEAEELSNNIRKEELWLKAIQNTNGDKNRALSLYIKYQSEVLKTEKINLEKQEKEKKEIIRFNLLEVFLKEKNLTIKRKISPFKVVANYVFSPIDVNIEYKNEEWKVVEIWQ